MLGRLQPWEGGGISCFLVKQPVNTKEKATCLPQGHCSRVPVIPLLASAAPRKHSAPATQNLFWFPKGCSLSSICCCLCLEYSFLTSSMAKSHSSYRGLSLDVTSDRKSTRLTPSQLGQEPLLDHQGPMAFHHHRSNYSGSVYTHDTHLQNRHMVNIGGVKYVEKEVSSEWPRDHEERGGGPGCGQHLKEHSKNSSSRPSLGCLGR